MASTRHALRDLTTWFGECPGADRVLIGREPMEAWLHEVAANSTRLAIEAIGESTEGREMWLAVVSSADTLQRLDAVRTARASLTDATLLADPAHDDGSIAGTKPVVLLTAGIHATEVGGVQLMPELIAELALSDDERITRLLDRVVVLVVPTLNPDGMDLVHDWYRQTLGTASEGTVPPMLYHRYAGHDNNRDWYTHALAETRNVVNEVHRPWRPNVVLDLHQMGEHAPRYVLPPFIDPVEPHVHPLLTSMTSAVGAHLSLAHHRKGHRGVASGVLFDSYSPTRSFQSYHGGVRILAEAASARIATPATVEVAQLDVRRGFDPKVAGVHNPLPWDGGVWRLRDIMNYHLVTIHSLLDHVANHAGTWTRDTWTILADEVRTTDRPLYAVAPLRQQVDPRAAKEMVGILQRGDVAMEIVDTPGQVAAPGTILVRGGQPFGSYAGALLDLTPYPDMATTPYDVTSHCLPVHMGVEVRTLPPGNVVESRSLDEHDLSVFPPPVAADAGRDRWLAIDHRSHASVRIVSDVLRNGAKVRRLIRPHFDGGRLLQPGTWLVAGDHALDAMSRASRETVRSWLVRPVAHGTSAQRMPRIGLYIPALEDAIDGGWLRLMLEHLSLPYTIIRDQDCRDGNLGQVDVLLFADQDPDALLKGNTTDDYPVPYAGGLGLDGIEGIRAWTSTGGTVIAIDGAARALAERLGLPLRFPLASAKPERFASPGAVVRVEPVADHPLMIGIDEPFPALIQGGNAFATRPRHHGSPFAAHFAPENPLVSGWLRGPELLKGLAAIADIPLGDGRVVTFAFRPHFRTQMLASYAPLINAIMRAGTPPERGAT